MKRSALRFIVLLGIVSLFADMTYEGARSVTGPYLAILGASATIVGVVGGLGEFIGYGSRIIFGSLADRTGRYWIITISGYTLNLLTVPFLALTSHWQIAAILIMAERFGKAVRTPARDVMLSHAAKEIGSGWGFGLHEAMDQIGAVVGPVIISVVLYLRGSYSQSFTILLVPASLAIFVLVLSKKLYPTPQVFEKETKQRISPSNTILTTKDNRKFSRLFWLYLLFVSISVAGYVNFQLISYHFQVASIISDNQIPVLFAIAMATDALVALVMGRLFDKKGLLTLIAIPVLSVSIAPLVFSMGSSGAVIGMILWGAVMGTQDTIMRAVIGNTVPVAKRGIAYGIFNTAYGGSWLVGSVLMGLLYDTYISYVIFLSILLELLSILPLFYFIKRFTIKGNLDEI
jgi:MFS family permease